MRSSRVARIAKIIDILYEEGKHPCGLSVSQDVLDVLPDLGSPDVHQRTIDLPLHLVTGKGDGFFEVAFSDRDCRKILGTHCETLCC